MIVIIPAAAAQADINRLTNQLWKLIPMRENEENWQGQLESVILELMGLKDIYLIADDKFLTLLIKLQGLRNNEIMFSIYRKTVFECISLLREMRL